MYVYKKITYTRMLNILENSPTWYKELKAFQIYAFVANYATSFDMLVI